MLSPLHKALLACTLFAGFAVAAFLFGKEFRLPLFIYYCLLVFNTFFSIRVLSSITPPHAVQAVFDAVLVFIYAALAFAADSTFLFSAVSATLFVVATLKYVHLKNIVQVELRLLRRKIVLNILSALVSVTVFAIALAGYADIAAWILCGVFGISNFYLLAINPMYRTDQPR